MSTDIQEEWGYPRTEGRVGKSRGRTLMALLEHFGHLHLDFPSHPPYFMNFFIVYVYNGMSGHSP